ncbi:gliding motility lipoprotein GldH [Cecembia rubra]|uniref:Gliding motility-associated lipoprotein GldH n=1 Tax=Cecembia rubra TaxID=1485585 RepID=A0A2P8DRN1_9BACT|nr:gliding motility lipoprotein GldH [Cecembia rubra]PSK99870.1 gliding motility-associated lipoprotein GldH [Cecembia rubra]
MRIALNLTGLLIVLLLFFQCSGNREFEQYLGMENISWGLQDTISFTMTHPLPEGVTILAVKYNNDYPYRNLYIRYVLKDSTDHIFESQLINIPLFENTSGKPLGKGYGSTYTRYDTLPLTSKVPYSKIEFLHYMRLEELKGIEAIGLKRVNN